MATKLVCPDCGGVIGEAAPGDAPCTCFPAEASDDANSDTAHIESPARIEKLCVVCGRNTAGHRRLKDSRGYICYPCAKGEQAAEKAGKLRCKLCRKLVKPNGLVPMGRKMVCRTCFADFEERAKFSKKISTKHYDMIEKRRLIVLASVFGVLSLIVLYSMIFKHPFSPLANVAAPNAAAPTPPPAATEPAKPVELPATKRVR